MLQSSIILQNSSSHFILFNRPNDKIYSISTKELLSFVLSAGSVPSQWCNLLPFYQIAPHISSSLIGPMIQSTLFLPKRSFLLILLNRFCTLPMLCNHLSFYQIAPHISSSLIGPMIQSTQFLLKSSFLLILLTGFVPSRWFNLLPFYIIAPPFLRFCGYWCRRTDEIVNHTEDI